MEAIRDQKQVTIRFFTNPEEKGHRLIGNHKGKVTFPDNELSEMIETNGWLGALLNVRVYQDPHRTMSTSILLAEVDRSAKQILVCPNGGLSGKRITMLIDGQNFLSALEKMRLSCSIEEALNRVVGKYDSKSEIRFYICRQTAMEAKLITAQELDKIAQQYILIDRPPKIITTKAAKLIKDCPVVFRPIGTKQQSGMANWKGQFGKFVVFPDPELEELINNLKLEDVPINVWLEKITNHNGKKRMTAYLPEKPGQNKKTTIKSDIDHLIIAEIVRQAEAIKNQKKHRPEGLVIVSGDSDYEDSLRYLAGIEPYHRRHNRGQMEIISSLNSLSVELRNLANHQRICLRLLEEELV